MTFHPLRQVEATRISPFTGQEIRYLDADADPEQSNAKYRPTRKIQECNESVWSLPKAFTNNMGNEERKRLRSVRPCGHFIIFLSSTVTFLMTIRFLLHFSLLFTQGPYNKRLMWTLRCRLGFLFVILRECNFLSVQPITYLYASQILSHQFSERGHIQ
jgi:hypothetical protein